VSLCVHLADSTATTPTTHLVVVGQTATSQQQGQGPWRTQAHAVATHSWSYRYRLAAAGVGSAGLIARSPLRCAASPQPSCQINISVPHLCPPVESPVCLYNSPPVRAVPAHHLSTRILCRRDELLRPAAAARRRAAAARYVCSVPVLPVSAID